MNAKELLEIISTGETSKVQFKREMNNDDSIAAELIALSNSKGGMILFGIEDKKGTIVGLDYQQLQSYNNRIATIANDIIKPQIFLYTEVVSISLETGKKKILVVEVAEGTAKPYKDKNGIIWIKQGSDKRKLTDNNEQIRLFQQSGILYVDEIIIPQTSIDDINYSKVEQYINAIKKQETNEAIEISETVLKNLNILKDNRLTLGGLLFFAKNPQKYRPAFCVKAISFFGNSIGGTEYRSSQDIVGTIPQMFEETMRFFTTNLYHIQAGQNFNKTGILEVSQTALEELVQNALVHRDYSKNAPIRVMIFDNRIEIVSPGSLPNSLTVENVKMGNAVVRNNLIVSYCSKLMIYRGFGSGITRALTAQPNIELINDAEGEQFRVVIPRPEKK
ncbi:MAG: putative DNA binding domain-containing protein [Bacteroidales bacterium]|jgi:predicted HTH transcriptional regulator|nr:putative DNA binding domain-containing protein [Bacteroidales bacterium]HPY81924.1 putative DNA binding domain-containing protein [Bacteroidales bacterium]